MRRCVPLAALLLLVRPAHGANAEALALMAALRAGGVVAVMRHGITDRNQVDTGDLDNRAGQRNLNQAGGAQSVRVGRAFPALGIPLGAVLTGPVFRARDTAALAFGLRAVVEPLLTAGDYTPDAAQRARQIAWLRARSGRPAAFSAMDVLVGHIIPLRMAPGCGLGQADYPEGSSAVFAPGIPAGRLLGIVTDEALFAAAGV